MIPINCGSWELRTWRFFFLRYLTEFRGLLTSLGVGFIFCFLFPNKIIQRNGDWIGEEQGITPKRRKNDSSLVLAPRKHTAHSDILKKTDELFVFKWAIKKSIENKEYTRLKRRLCVDVWPWIFFVCLDIQQILSSDIISTNQRHVMLLCSSSSVVLFCSLATEMLSVHLTASFCVSLVFVTF